MLSKILPQELLHSINIQQKQTVIVKNVTDAVTASTARPRKPMHGGHSDYHFWFFLPLGEGECNRKILKIRQVKTGTT